MRLSIFFSQYKTFIYSNTLLYVYRPELDCKLKIQMKMEPTLISIFEFSFNPCNEVTGQFPNWTFILFLCLLTHTFTRCRVPLTSFFFFFLYQISSCKIIISLWWLKLSPET